MVRTCVVGLVAGKAHMSWHASIRAHSHATENQQNGEIPMVKRSCEVPGALLMGNFSQRHEEGWERFTVGKTRGHRAPTFRVGASVQLE